MVEPDEEEGGDNEEIDCISSIIKKTKYPYVITYFDNFNSGISLTKAWNELIERSDYEYICLLNNDTKVTLSWLERLVDVLDKDSTIICVGPSTNNCHSIQRTIATEEEAILHKNEIEIMKDPLSGFCILFRRNFWSKIKFDERFPFYGQESLFQWKVQQLGYKLAWRKDSFVYHIGEASIKSSNMDVDIERNKAKRLYWQIVRGKIK